MGKGVGDVGKAELVEEAVQLTAAVPDVIRDAAAAAAAEIAEFDVDEIGEKITALTEAADEKVRSSMGKAGKTVVAGALVVAAAAGGYYAWSKYKAAEAGPDDAEAGTEGESSADVEETVDVSEAPEPVEPESSEESENSGEDKE